MFVGRFKVQCHADRAEEMAAALVAVEGPSRALPGVVSFDVARSLTDPNSFVVTEVFIDRPAWERQNSQPEVARVLEIAGAGALTAPFEWRLWQASDPD